MLPWLSYLAMSKNATLPPGASPLFSGLFLELPTTVLVTCVPCPMVPPSFSVFSCWCRGACCDCIGRFQGLVLSP
jgi:hypothetical protein